MTQEVDSTYWNISKIAKPSIQIAGPKNIQHNLLFVKLWTNVFYIGDQNSKCLKVIAGNCYCGYYLSCDPTLLFGLHQTSYIGSFPQYEKLPKQTNFHFSFSPRRCGDISELLVNVSFGLLLCFLWHTSSIIPCLKTEGRRKGHKPISCIYNDQIQYKYYSGSQTWPNTNMNIFLNATFDRIRIQILRLFK